jgi:hypothetical protein
LILSKDELLVVACDKGDLCVDAVVNMATYAISSSLILVIHDNMINGTNHILLSMSLYTFLGPKDAKIPHAKMRRLFIFQGSKPSKERKRKDTIG